MAIPSENVAGWTAAQVKAISPGELLQMLGSVRSFSATQFSSLTSLQISVLISNQGPTLFSPVWPNAVSGLNTAALAGVMAAQPPAFFSSISVDLWTRLLTGQPNLAANLVPQMTAAQVNATNWSPGDYANLAYLSGTQVASLLSGQGPGVLAGSWYDAAKQFNVKALATGMVTQSSSFFSALNATQWSYLFKLQPNLAANLVPQMTAAQVNATNWSPGDYANLAYLSGPQVAGLLTRQGPGVLTGSWGSAVKSFDPAALADGLAAQTPSFLASISPSEWSDIFGKLPGLQSELYLVANDDQLSAVTLLSSPDFTPNTRLPRSPQQSSAYAQMEPHLYHNTTTQYGSNVSLARKLANGTGVNVMVIDHPVMNGSTVQSLSKTNHFDAPGTATSLHGDSVASVIGNSGVGVAPSAIITEWATANLYDVISGFTYATDATNRIRVMNMSLCFINDKDGLLEKDLGQAYGKLAPNAQVGNGISFVVAAGNDHLAGLDVTSDPATDQSGVIVVGAVDQSGEVADFSERGSSLLLSAVGTDVSVVPRIGETTTASGTSFAAPIVSGVIAMMYQVNPHLNSLDVNNILVQSTYQASGESLARSGAGTWNGGSLIFNNDVGFGILDAYTAVSLARAWVGGSETRVGNTAIRKGEIVSSEGNTGSGILDFDQGIRVEDATVSIEGLNNHLLSDLTIQLISPSGTISDLISNTGVALQTTTNAFGEGIIKGNSTGVYAPISIESNAFWGQSAMGEWVIRLTDKSGHLVSLPWQLELGGSNLSLAHNNPLVYTPVFPNVQSSVGARFSGVPLVDESKSSTLDLIGLSNENVVRLSAGLGKIDGVPVYFNGGGTSTVNMEGSTGNTTLYSAVGQNMFHLGSGPSTFIGQGGNDTLYGDDGPISIEANNDVSIAFIGGSGSTTLNAGSAKLLNITTGAGPDRIVVDQNVSGRVVNVSGLSVNEIISVGYMDAISGGRMLAQQTYHPAVGNNPFYTQIMGYGTTFNFFGSSHVSDAQFVFGKDIPIIS